MEQNACINTSSGDYYINASSGDYYINGSSGVNYVNVDLDRQMWKFFKNIVSAHSLIIMIIAAIDIPIMILTLLALCALIQSQRSTLVFVINLILSDLIQIICRLTESIKGSSKVIMAYYYSLIVGVYFMACVAVERYLLVSHPIWYKSHHSLKVCCGISVIVWFVPLMFADINSNVPLNPLIKSIACLIPYPIIILCFVGTCRGLSRSISLTPLKRKKILGSLFLVLLTYTFLILPYIIVIFMLYSYSYNYLLLSIFSYCSTYLLFLNPLADCVLYMFIRPDVGGLMRSVHCCCRAHTHQNSTHSRTHTHQNSTHSRDEHSRDSSAAFACCVSMQNPSSHSQTACSSV